MRLTRGLERDDYGDLEHLRADSAGLYRLLVTNEVPETQYTNSMRLLVVDHRPGARFEMDEFGRGARRVVGHAAIVGARSGRPRSCPVAARRGPDDLGAGAADGHDRIGAPGDRSHLPEAARRHARQARRRASAPASGART